MCLKKKELNVKNMGLHCCFFILEPIHHKGWISMLRAVIPGTSVLTYSSHYLTPLHGEHVLIAL